MPPEVRFAQRIRLGVLTSEITPEIAREVLERTGRLEIRRRVLPARATVYFVLALCLFGSAESAGAPGYRVVLRSLSNRLRHIPDLAFQRLPTSSALTRARQRLGDKPLQALFERLSGPLATPDLTSAFAWSRGTAPRWMCPTPRPTPRSSDSPARTASTSAGTPRPG